jgi:arginase family enzyme
MGKWTTSGCRFSKVGMGGKMRMDQSSQAMFSTDSFDRAAPGFRARGPEDKSESESHSSPDLLTSSGFPVDSAMPSTQLPDARVSPRFAGVCTLCRYPRLEDVPAASRPLDWLLYGIPFDGGVTYRPGARFGPRAIREASQYVKRYHLEHAVDVCDKLSLADAGDAPISPYSIKQTLEGAAKWAAALDLTSTPAPSPIRDPQSPIRNPPKLLAVGGDHSIAYANIKATWERRGRPRGGLALLHFDSHLDTVDEVWGEKWGHASVFRRCIEEKLIDPARMLSVGLKGPLNTGADLDYAKQQGITILTAEQYHRSVRQGTGEVETFVKELAGTEAYLTFDIDIVDPAYAPGTGTPSVGGLTSAEVLRLLRSLKGANIVGADVVEVLPAHDPAGITSLLAAHILFEVLALDAVQK